MDTTTDYFSKFVPAMDDGYGAWLSDGTALLLRPAPEDFPVALQGYWVLTYRGFCPPELGDCGEWLILSDDTVRIWACKDIDKLAELAAMLFSVSPDIEYN